jgi:hypothetical protein
MATGKYALACAGPFRCCGPIAEAKGQATPSAPRTSHLAILYAHPELNTCFAVHVAQRLVRESDVLEAPLNFNYWPLSFHRTGGYEHLQVFLSVQDLMTRYF